MYLKHITIIIFVSVLSFFISIASQEAIGEEKAFQKKKFTNSLGMKFVLIPAGTFTMGSPSWEKGRDSEEKQHEVTLTRGFYMQVTEVTQGQWQSIMGSNRSDHTNCGSDCPVEMVSWNDCQEFIRKLNQKEGTNKYRLPTEAEWEYACRAGSTTPFSWGTDRACADYAWCGKRGSRNHPVGQKNPNAWGLYDMHGNVWEWCQDWYEKKNYPIGHVTDPKGPSYGRNRVLRGGGWSSSARLCRSALRGRNYPGARGIDTGFRVARDF